MNIYEIFEKESPKRSISYEKLQGIARKYNLQDVPIHLLCEHRKIYHLRQMQARYWKPVNRRVEPSPNDATFGYIAPNGDLRPTKTTTKDSWSVRSIYSCSKLLDRRRALSRTIQDAYYRLQDRRFNICLINEHTVPKWIPSVRHLSMDPATALSQVVEKLLGGSHLVLRCKQLEPNSNQCELWTFSLRTKTMTRDYVTVAEGIAARGKTPATSARKHTRMMAVQVTKALQC